MTGQGGERSQDADACVHREPDAESQGSQSLPRSCPQAWLRSHADFSPTGTVRARAPDRSEHRVIRPLLLKKLANQPV